MATTACRPSSTSNTTRREGTDAPSQNRTMKVRTTGCASILDQGPVAKRVHACYRNPGASNYHMARTLDARPLLQPVRRNSQIDCSDNQTTRSAKGAKERFGPALELLQGL